MAGNPNWWRINGMHQQYSQQQISSSHLSTASSEYLYGSSSLSSNSSSAHHPNQDFPVRSWSQLLLGGFTGDEDIRFDTTLLQQKKLENWEDQVLYSSSFKVPVLDVKQESDNIYSQVDDEFQICKSYLPQVIPVSSPNSCITSLSNSFLNFSSAKGNRKTQNPDQYSSKCNSTITGGESKKPRVQQSSIKPALKVRKEKLGDRITTLHQLVSPFGKTDTASVLSETIGYIRFLQAQIEALYSPYMRSGSGNIGQQQQYVQERNCLFHEEHVQGKQNQVNDLRSGGLCLVPVSFTQHVGDDIINGASDCWTPALGGGF